MAYCTQQNLLDRFGLAELTQLTDHDNLGVINATVLDLAIADATAEIDAYLTGYALPLATVPANLVRIAGDIARYYLYDDAPIEQVQLRYDNAMKYLVQVARGIISLGPDATGTVATSTNNSAQFESSPSVFGRDG